MITKRMGVSTFQNAKQIVFTFSVIATGEQTVSGVFRTLSGQSIEVFWGDGSAVNIYTGTTGQPYTHTYVGAGTYIVNIVARDGLCITYFTSSATSKLSFNLTAMRNLGLFYYGDGWNSNNTITGNISDLPRCLTNQLYLYGTTATGDIITLPNIAVFYIGGTNTIYGNINTIKSTVQTFDVRGRNTISGDISAIPITLPYFYCDGYNTITGDLGLLPSSVTTFFCGGYSTITTYTSKVWPSTMSRVSLMSNTTQLSAALNDQVLIDLANVSTWTNDKIVQLRGTRTSASNAAVTTLQGKGVSVTPAAAS